MKKDGKGNRGLMGCTMPGASLHLEVDEAGTVFLADESGKAIAGVSKLFIDESYEGAVQVTATLFVAPPPKPDDLARA
jgi:hypothetical protein